MSHVALCSRHGTHMNSTRHTYEQEMDIDSSKLCFWSDYAYFDYSLKIMYFGYTAGRDCFICETTHLLTHIYWPTPLTMLPPRWPTYTLLSVYARLNLFTPLSAPPPSLTVCIPSYAHAVNNRACKSSDQWARSCYSTAAAAVCATRLSCPTYVATVYCPLSQTHYARVENLEHLSTRHVLLS